MKKYFSIAVLCALAVLGLGSCAKDIEEEIVTEQTGVRTVTFSASLADQTKTGLSMKFVPNWINTSLENVHLFETCGSTILEGVDVEMRIPADRNNEVAYFKADFSQEISIIVNPPSQTGVKTRAGEEYTYTGIVAQKADGKFTIPPTQTPDPVSLIDPNADFLIGDTKTNFSESMALKEMDIYFHRPVSVSRLAIMNIEGETVKTVKITSNDKLTASAAYGDVNFSASTVNWDNSGSNVLTISYGEGKEIPGENTFYAYFISLPGNKSITSIEVTTDQYVYTKSYASGKTLKFDTVEFRNIAVDMSKVTPTPVGPAQPVDQDIYFFKDNERKTEDSYDLYPGTTPYVTPELRGAATGATVTYSIECTPAGAATISPAGVVTPVAVGTAVITATASAVTGYNRTSKSYTLTITDSTPDAVDQDLSFVKDGVAIENDTFDLYPTGGTYTAPTLTGAAEGATVTYAIECTPEGVATIDASTGAVTPVAVGTAVITATASAVAPLYKQTSASYTLTVSDSTPAPVEETTYTLVTSSGTLTKGTYILISDDSSTSYNNRYTVALFPTVITTSWDGSSPVENGQRFNEKDVTLSGSSITTTDAEIVNAEIELVPDGSNWKIKAKKTGEYLATPTANYTIPLTLNGDEAASFEISSAQNRSIKVGNYYFFHSGSATGFTIRNTGTTVSNIRFYKKVLKTQALSFPAESAVYDLNGDTWTTAVPTLDKSGAFTEVTYASSNTAVAAVDATTGAITLGSVKKGDTAIITATATGNDEYEEATASYTITVVDTTPGVTATYNKVTNAADLEVGAKYLIVFEGLAGDTDGDGDPKVFDPVLNDAGTHFAKATSSALPVTIANSTIQSSEFGDCQFTLESGYYLKADKANRYIYTGTSNGSSVLPAEATASHALTITFENGNALILYDTRYIVWSTYSHYFSSNTGFASSNNATYICLYKLDDGRTPQTLTFTADEAEYDLGTSSWTKAVPTLSGNQTSPLTWESSNEAVATVNASGIVTPVAKGTTTISVTAPADETYKTGYASYTVKVVNSNVPTYYKADAIVAGESYLIVSGGYALRNNNGSVGANAVQGSGATIQFDAENADFWTATADGTSFRFTNNSQYLRLQNNSLVINGNASGTASNNQWTYDAENGYLRVGSRYLYYSNNAFTTSSSSTNHNAALYTTTPPTTPQTLSYTPTEASYDLYTEAWTPSMPTLGGDYHTTVTYESTNDAIVEVVGGVLTPKAVGTATITATAPADATYTVATATCTITVTDSTPVTGATTYTQISFADGITTGKYLIVNPANAQVFTAVTGNPNAEAVSPASGVITGNYSAYEFTITKSGDNITIQNGSNQYLYYVYASGSTASRVAYSATANGTWTAKSVSSDANGFDLNWQSGTSSQHIYWSDTFFKIGSQTTGVHLYKLNDGGTTPPDDPEPPTPSTVSYTKVDAVTSGATYLIVSHTDAVAMVGNGTTTNDNVNYIAVSPSAGVISGAAADFEECEAVITEESSGSYSIYFTKLEKYLYYTSSQSGLTYGNRSSSNDFTLSTVASGNYAGSFLFTKSSRYLYYNNTFFKIGGSGDTLGVHLYKKN